MRIGARDSSILWVFIHLFVCFLLPLYASYDCIHPGPRFKFLRPPEDDCVAGGNALLSRPNAANTRLFVTAQYDPKLPLVIQVPKSWRFRSCLITIDFNNGYSLESGSLKELGITTHLLALKCLSKETLDFFGARASWGATNALSVILHGNVTMNEATYEGNTTVIDDLAFGVYNDTAEDLATQIPDNTSRRRK